MPASQPVNPFGVKDEFAFLEGLLNVYWEGMGGPPDLAPAGSLRPLVLDRESARQQAARSFLEGILTPDLADSLGARTRTARLWQRSPELWCEAFNRLDLRFLVVTARERFLEYWEMWMDVERRLSDLRAQDRLEPLTGERQVAWAREARRWFAEARERQEVWTWLFAEHLRAELVEKGHCPSETAACEEVGARDVIHKAVLEAAESPDDPAKFVKLAVLAVPGLCLLDVREMIPSKCLGRRTWRDVTHELLTDPNLVSCAHIVTEETEDEIMGRRSQKDRPEDRLDRLASPLTRILWSRDVYRIAADAIWSLWRSPETHDAIRGAIERVREGLRLRFWHTRDPHYRQLALVFRFAASRHGEGTRSIDNATQRFRREIYALRRQQHVGWEAGLHRWMDPHCAQVRGGEDDPTLWTTFHRIEHWATGLHALWSWLEGWSTGEMASSHRGVAPEVVERFKQRARALVAVPSNGVDIFLTPTEGEDESTAVRAFLSSFWTRPSLVGAIAGFLMGPGRLYLKSRRRSWKPRGSGRLASEELDVQWLGLRVVAITSLLQRTRPDELREDRASLPWGCESPSLDALLGSLVSGLVARYGQAALGAADAVEIADEIDGKLVRYVHDRREREASGRVELEMLAAVQRWIEDVTEEWTPCGSKTRLFALVAERVLNQVIKSSERHHLDYTRMVARLTWALELPLVLGRAPDIGRLAPAIHVLEDRAGRRAIEQLERTTQNVALRAFARKELDAERRGSPVAWAEVTDLATRAMQGG